MTEEPAKQQPVQSLLLPEDERFDQEDWEKYEVGITPLDPIVQYLETNLRGLPDRRRGSPFRVLDVGAGSGSFGLAMRHVWGVSPDLVAVEVRESEIPQLRNIYDTVVPGDFDDAAVRDRLGTFDLILGNPPFKRMRPVESSSEQTWLDHMLGLRRTTACSVVQLMPGDYCQRRAVEHQYLLEHPPYEESVVPGRMAFYGGSSTDIRIYSWWHWCGVVVACDRICTWPRHVMPALRPEQLRWRVRPGDSGDHLRWRHGGRIL